MDVQQPLFGINRYGEHGMPASNNVGRFQFTGQAWLPEAGLYYFKARFYSASLGRFLQTDPIGYGGGMNLYAYVKGDPVNFTDPMGLHRNRPDEGIGGDIIPDVVIEAKRIYDEIIRREEIMRKDLDGLFVYLPGSGNADNFELPTPQSQQDGGSWIPGTQAGHNAATYWADRVVASTFTEDPLARVGLAFSVLWTPDTALDTALTLGSAGTVAIAERAGLLWFRAYPNAGGEGIGINWGGKNVFRIDWHRFQLDGQNVFRPHIDSKPLGLKHWPWQ